MKKGILFIVLSGLSFLIVNFLVKLFGMGSGQTLFPNLQKIPAHELVLTRSIISFSISSVIIKSKKLPFFGVNKKWLLIRGFAGMIALTLFFETIHHLPIAVASTVQYLAPIFTMISTMLFLGERILKMQWLFVLVAFIGVTLIGLNALILKTNPVKLDFFWLILGVISAAFSGIAYTAIVKLKATDAPINIVSYFPMLSIPIMTVWCLFDFVMPRGIEWLLLLIIGIFTQIAQMLLTKALHQDSASLITPFQYLGSIYAMLMGYFIFEERLNFLIIIGVGLILMGVVANTLIKALQRKEHKIS
ncbi:MAG: DMT family transporter [Flavobacteriales bacterium]|nr:DMT family transporter [Crocinitomicaceae bacterium]NBX79828.1 DMT family transporter [Flavobacteriales bacterium]